MTKKKNGWTDKRTTYIQKTLKDGRLKIEGDYYLDNVQFSYKVTEQKDGEYTMRGEVVPRSPNDGHRMRFHGKKRREILKRLAEKGITGEAADKHESMVIRRTLYLHEMSEKAIKEEIVHAVESLLGEISIELSMEAKQIPGGQLTVPQMVHLYGQKFINKLGNRSQKTYQRNLKTLELLSGKLGNRPVSQISTDQVKAVVKSLEGDVDAKVRLAARFWDFCAERGVIGGDNPFKRFLRQYDVIKKKKITVIQQKALRASTLPQKVEETLNRMIANADATDAKTTGVLIIKEIDGVSARRACDLTWGDFLFNADDPDRVRVILKNEDIAGATHDFTRPCSRFCAREIKRRYNALDGQRGINRKTYILLKQDGKRVTPKELTAFCREALLNAGMSYSDLQPDRKEPNGVGVQLLNKNLHSRITNICGLGRDKGASKYSAVESLAGYTTSDHYRSLSCEEGQDFLQIIMNRDGRFEEAPQVDRELCEDHPDGTNTMCFLTTDYDRLTSGMVQYILAPGESIIVSAEGGVTGSVAASRVRKLSKGKKVSEETEILEETDVLEEKETPDETEALEETETFGKVETPEESAVASNNNIESVVVEETIDCDIQLSLFD